MRYLLVSVNTQVVHLCVARLCAVAFLLFLQSFCLFASSPETTKGAAKPSLLKQKHPEADIVGVAYAQDEDQVIYYEYHYLNSSERRHQVFYEGPEGQPLAEKNLHYAIDFNRPSFRQVDKQTGETLKLDVEEDQIVVEYFPQAGHSAKETTLSYQGLMIVDAGFDHFIREHWQILSRGDVIDFSFPSAHHQRIYQLRIKASECQQQAEEDSLCLVIEPKNWLARLFVDSIRLVYSKQNKALARYQGIANILPASDGNQVDIRYTYREKL